MIKRCLCTFLAVMLLAFCAGCDQTPEQTLPTTLPTQAPTTQPTVPATEPVDPLEALRSELAANGQAFAAAYLGDTYDEEKDLPALLQELAPALCLQYPFLTEIPGESAADVGCGEIFCLIPADPEAAVRVYRAVEYTDADWNFHWEYSDLIYESTTGQPFFLVCNRYGDYPDVEVTVTDKNGESVWHPWQNGYRRLEMPEEEARFLDISDYAAIFTRYYRNNQEGYRLPTGEDLLGKAWGWEGTPLYDSRYITCLLAFAEAGATVRWSIGGEGESHELTGIPWKLTQAGEFAVLTLELGEPLGTRSYNLLYDTEYGWLYTVVDLSQGIVTQDQEQPFRSLEPRDLNAPSPMEAVGTWVRIRTEFEGWEETDTTGSRTLVITGETEDSLTATFTNAEQPEHSYRDKPLEIRQGQLYWGCGNSLWLADVAHEGPWGTTYALTVLTDGKLLVQNYWEMDGAPSVSYEWYERADGKPNG